MTEQQKTKEEIQKAIIELIVRNQQAIQTVIVPRRRRRRSE
jgi:hypothetical protein